MRNYKLMTTFDKACAILSIPIGAIFMVLGAIGLFTGSNAHFTLPPILGGLPFFLGWAMCVPLVKYWSMTNAVNNEVDIDSANLNNDDSKVSSSDVDSWPGGQRGRARHPDRGLRRREHEPAAPVARGGGQDVRFRCVQRR